MRLNHPDGTVVHLAYCTNVHPAEDLAGILAQLDTFAAPVRATLDADVLGLGLWLAAPVAAALAADRALRVLLRRELDARGLEVVTFNGFPYQTFHAPVVKHAVYRPDWTDRRRLDYTLDLALILADLLPDDAARGSISTLPFGWRTPWGTAEADGAARLLDDLARGLARQHRAIRVAVEPEPGCVVETTPQAIAALSGVDPDRIGLCLDLAHLACAWEDPARAVASLAAAGVPVVKTQVSAALEVTDPRGAADILSGYAEPRFLHQTRTRAGAAYDDLPEALAADPDGPWRVHFHVPIHAAPEPPLSGTTPVLRAGLAALVGGPVALCDHLEVETYTWNVLPADRRPRDDAALVAGIAAEVAFAHRELLDLGLTPEGSAPASPDPGAEPAASDRTGTVAVTR
ncbi:xylose isomerase [Longispora fulva]|uniref:Sugar phosphate isomerase/epimerase n=1 Tax=Longispora fulva TaxID=619741 RepID=A0A8J7GGF3_9ACTN|nr:metabolite traffic protein EboE [Longispora fulva]MBG6135578.1 sugar phosphate isomerase/epimerase [Longispora fulva]GIG56183.1 xylose isomerase [Longispora fulva]